ncbi:PREDICTED: NAC domain-containing protein 35-like isoform X2 [Ipomoea nil]|uniref:NAC domain-containing protein 35-like isoform X2 n=1 Tax=Ipomoea nil TaxID=35883 RepID=UPI0009013009|nr:PREDICTED: NAC domain-containing protein 35-like isoform X2 [Ipomoea nil]
MAVLPEKMSQQNQDERCQKNTEEEAAAAAADDHEHDMVMPGFRFHPTEEELVEFYLRRKVEGKRFNVELITFLDLYRYDPWELPAIGEKEWFFYVPRDRKYRNGDRPNRVTTSGYWKATGADRMIRGENSRSIGLKKTLVFYSGKAPKGIRTSWIMNEYRLPHHETERLQKAEISLCRVYKRAGVDDHHPSLPRSLQTSRASAAAAASSSSSRGPAAVKKLQEPSFSPYQVAEEKISAETSASSSTEVGTSLGLSSYQSSYAAAAAPPSAPFFSASSSAASVDDLHRLVNSQQQISLQHPQLFQTLSSPFPPPPLLHPLPPQPLALPPGSLHQAAAAAAFSDRLWDWSSMGEPSRDYGAGNPFK